MPQAAVVAAIPAAASLVGGALQHRGARNAANDQRRATQQALAMEQQREAERQRRATEAAEARRLRFLAYYDRHGDAAIDRYGIPAGIDPGIIPARRPSTGRTRRVVPSTVVQPGALPAGRQPAGLLPPAGLMDSQQPGGTGQIRSGGDVFDWERYL